jgi:hypothetical protein
MCLLYYLFYVLSMPFENIFVVFLQQLLYTQHL